MVLLVSTTAAALIDYELEFASGIVVESKKIVIPNFPGAFNPSIIRYQGELLLSFRFIPNRSDNMTSYLGIVSLNEDLTLKGDPRVLNLRVDSEVKCRAEDARLITVGENLYAVYSDNIDPKITRGGFRVFVVQMWFENGELRISKPEKLDDFDGNNPEIREKNWVPFDSEGKLNLAYSIDPHLIFCPRLDQSGRCDTFANTQTPYQWSFGVLRGGTPAFLLGEEYLAFFHSSIRATTVHSGGKDMAHYFMGAYTFQKDAPHKLMSISKDPIVGPGYYSGPQFKGYWKPVRAVFPGGYVYDNDHIWVAFGKDDAEVWITKLDRLALMSSLVRLES